MAWADVSISGGGSTCWELAFMGLPNVIFILEKNQAGIAEGLAKADAAVNIGWFDRVSNLEISDTISAFLHDRASRKRFNRNGRKLVTGSGADLVISALINQYQ